MTLDGPGTAITLKICTLWTKCKLQDFGSNCFGIVEDRHSVSPAAKLQPKDSQFLTIYLLCRSCGDFFGELALCKRIIFRDNWDDWSADDVHYLRCIWATYVTQYDTPTSPHTRQSAAKRFNSYSCCYMEDLNISSLFSSTVVFEAVAPQLYKRQHSSLILGHDSWVKVYRADDWGRVKAVCRTVDWLIWAVMKCRKHSSVCAREIDWLTDAAEQVRDSIMTSRHCTENYLCMCDSWWWEFS